MTLIQKTVTRYTLNGKTRLPDRQRVTKDTPGAVKTTRKLKTWYAKLPGQTKLVKLSKNKVVAQQMLGNCSAKPNWARSAFTIRSRNTARRR